MIITASASVQTDDPVKCFTTEVGTQTEYQEKSFYQPKDYIDLLNMIIHILNLHSAEVHHQSSVVQQSMNSISTKTSGEIADKTNSEGTILHKMNEMVDVKTPVSLDADNENLEDTLNSFSDKFDHSFHLSECSDSEHEYEYIEEPPHAEKIVDDKKYIVFESAHWLCSSDVAYVDTQHMKSKKVHVELH